jgi:hypothetical protein
VTSGLPVRKVQFPIFASLPCRVLPVWPPPDRPRLRRERRDRPPLPIRQTACITAVAPGLLAASGVSPGHSCLRPVSQPDKITIP